MNAGAIWWGQIGNSIQLLTKVTNHLRDRRSVILQIPSAFPWRQEFYGAIDRRKNVFCGQRRLLRLQWQEGGDPGEFILDELCSSRVRADYYPGYTYAQYLGSRNDIVLCEYYVWITGIHSRADIGKWGEFVAQYEHYAKNMEQSAVFVLEYDGAELESSRLEQITYTVEGYDCRVFCLEAAAALNNTDLHSYQAEMALCIGNSDPEQCNVLLEAGERLLIDPVGTTRDILPYACASDGRPFPPVAEQQIIGAARKAAIVLLFPILEQYRMEFIMKYEGELARHLPINNSNGDRVSDPFDLEIGPLHYIVTSCSRGFDKHEAATISLCRKTRNLLAHNKPVPYADVRAVMAL